MPDFCTCTHPNAGECIGGPVCPCACHRSMASAWQIASAGPREPLEDLHQQIAQVREQVREGTAEIQRLLSMLAYVAHCLDVSNFSVKDRDYVASIAGYITKRIPATEITDAFVSEQTIERLYDAVEANLAEEE